MAKQVDILKFFSSIPDHRVDRTKHHLVEDILFISIAAILCGAESWNDIEEFGEAKKKWLRSFLALPFGIPSHDTFNRFFSFLDPSLFENCFLEWTKSIARRSEGEIVSIDGKTIRGSRSGNPKTAIHMVSAWANNNQLVLGQVKVNNKSNEITAIPALLEVLMLEGSIVTMDAMGCQSSIVDKIIDRGADYLIAVKENQRTLLEDIKDAFRLQRPGLNWTDVDSGHGRVETRTCSLITDISIVTNHEKWQKLSALVKIESERFHKNTAVVETEVRYYITSINPNAEIIGKAVRSHWGIENSLHWVLDVAFSEDKSRKRFKNSAQNASILYRIATNILKMDTSTNRGIKGKRLKAGWDNNYLISLLKN